MGITGCNLCLVPITNDNFKLLEGALKDKLQVLIPVINWGNICREPKVCHKCSKIINKTYEFKIFCLDNNKRLQKLKKDKENSVKISDSEDEVEDEICCLCCQEDISEDFEVANVNLKEMVQKCFPQLNIYSSDNQGSCKECLKALKHLDSFTNSCLKSEKYVKDYCSSMGITRRDRFNFDECIKRKNCFSTTTNNRGDSETTAQEKETATPVVNGDLQSIQELNGMSFPQEKKLQLYVKDSEENATEQNKPTGSSSKQKETEENKKTVFSGKFWCDKCNYAAKAKSALVSHMMKHKDPSKTEMHMCQICGHETKRKGDLKWHMIVHKNPEEVTMYQCADCQYRTKRKADLKQHVMVHRPRLFKCHFCFFETNNEFYLNTSHMLLHNDKTEIDIKCELCPYATKSKALMKQHLRIHTEKFKCNWCNFDTLYKRGLRKHLLTHRCHSEREMFKCHLCDYEGGSKVNLKRHMLTHDHNPEIVFECEECTYKTKRKENLKCHVLKHKDQSEFKVHGCDLCAFKTTTKASLKSHLLSHIARLHNLPNKQSEIKTLILQRRNLSKS